MNKLIIEAGSSKSSWILLVQENVVLEFVLSGINPTTQSKSNILSILDIAIQKLGKLTPESIYFYGAGCKGVGKIMIQELLGHFFKTNNINVFSDLLAAARSSCQGKDCIIGILGTGSHSCFSDGHVIVHEIPSLGFLLGDEGSGNYYGKQILRSYFYGYMNPMLEEEFITSYPFVQQEYLSQLYSSPKMGFELAQFFPFLIKNKHEPLLKEIIQQGIEMYYKYRLSYYENKKQSSLYLIGNVGNQLKVEYLQFLNNKGFQQVFFNPNPIEGLINYHKLYV